MHTYVISSHINHESSDVEMVVNSEERAVAYVEIRAFYWKRVRFDYATVEVWFDGEYLRSIQVWTKEDGIIDELADRVGGSDA